MARPSMRDRIEQRLEYQRSKESMASPAEQSAEIINDIKENGVKAIDNLKGKVNGMDKTIIDKEMGKQSEDVYSDIKRSIVAGEEIIEIQMISNEQKLNGTMETVEYKIFFKNGNSKNLEFIYIKPTISGGMKLMDVKSAD